MTVKIQLNRKGVRALLRSPQVQADLKRRGDKIAAAAGPGHEVETFQGRNRARVTVRAVTDDAKVHPERLKAAIRAGR